MKILTKAFNRAYTESFIDQDQQRFKRFFIHNLQINDWGWGCQVVLGGQNYLVSMEGSTLDFLDLKVDENLEKILQLNERVAKNLGFSSIGICTIDEQEQSLFQNKGYNFKEIDRGVKELK